MSETEEVTGEQVLELPMNPDANDAGVGSVRDYLHALLLVLWEEGDNFSGKKPFGNSDWETELWSPLLEAGLVEGAVDAWGAISEIDRVKVDALIRKAILAL